MIDVTIPRNRRRFYLDRALRKKPIGAGSDLNALMALPRRPINMKIGELLGDIPWAVVGGIATIGYLSALAAGPAAVVVPLVATSPALAGLLGILLLKERTGPRQLAGIGLALAGAALLAGLG